MTMTWGMKLVGIGLLAVLLALAAMPALSQEATSEVTVDEAAEEIVDTAQGAGEATVRTADTLLSRLFVRPRSDIVRVLLVAGGVLLLVIGWRIYEYIILISGLLIGAAFAVSLVPEGNTVVTLAALLVGGVIGAVTGALLWYVAVFLIGAYLGILLTNGLAGLFNLTPVSPLMLLLGAVVGGAILIALSFELLVLLSALVGAQMITLGLHLGAEWTLILFVVGVIVQFVAARSLGYSVRRRPIRRNLLSWRRT